MKTVLSRRSFLKASLAASAAPLILPSRVLGADGGTSPNNRVTMGLIGCGAMGTADAIHFHNTKQVQLLAFCDVDRAKRDQKKADYEKLYAKEAQQSGWKGLATYNDFRELLARTDLDVVIVATPEHWHAIPVVAAAKAGKDIYCEKPLSYNVRDGQAMVAAVRANKRILQTGSQQRSHGDFFRAVEIVKAGLIGKVHTVYVRVGGPSKFQDAPEEPVPEGLDWDFWLGPAPKRAFNKRIHPGGWRSFREFAGGGTTDWGAHHFDIVQWALGMDGSGPVEYLPAGTDGHPCMGFRYASGTKVYHVFGGAEKKVEWPSPPEGDSNGITFIGDKGWVEVDRAHIRTQPESLLKEIVQLKGQAAFKRVGHHQNFLDCLKTRQDPICHIDVGYRSATVCHLANICHWTGQRFSWDPVKEAITDNPEAAKLLGREGREPWKSA